MTRIRRLSPLLRLAAAIALVVNAFALSPRPASAQRAGYCTLVSIHGGSDGAGGSMEAAKTGNDFSLMLPDDSHGNPEISIRRSWAGQRVYFFRNSIPGGLTPTWDFSHPDEIMLKADNPVRASFMLADANGGPDLEPGGMVTIKIWYYGMDLRSYDIGGQLVRRYVLDDTCGTKSATLTVGIRAPQAPTNYVVPGYQRPDPSQQQTRNNPPTIASAIADQTIVNQSGTQNVSLSNVFTDADGDALTLSAQSSATGVAAVSLSADFSSLTLTARRRGTATVTVTADDGNGGTVSDTFTVTVKAAPTVASPIADISRLAAGARRNVSLAGLFADADGDALTLSAVSSNTAIAGVSTQIDGVTQAVTGLTVRGVGAGTATITVTAQDVDGNRVSDSFTVTVPAPQLQKRDNPPAVTSDDGGTSASDTVTVTVKSAPTVASAIADISRLAVGASRQVSLSGVFADADGDALTLSVATSNSTVARVSAAGDGSSLTVLGVGAGMATITVTAQDVDGNRVSDTFDLLVAAAGTASTLGASSRQARRVELSWTEVSGASYAVARYDWTASRWEILSESHSATSYTDTAVEAGRSYTYQVSADGRNSWSNQARVYVGFYDAPTLNVPAVSSSGVELSWNAMSGVASYDVWRWTRSAGTWTEIAAAVSGTSFTDAAVAVGESYVYQAQAHGAAGPSAWSNQVEVTVPASTQ